MNFSQEEPAIHVTGSFMFYTDCFLKIAVVLILITNNKW